MENTREIYIIINRFWNFVSWRNNGKAYELQDRSFEVYNSSLSTDKKSYKEAQKSLKTEEEQTFSEKEIDVMLPSSIRRETREFKEK